MTNTNTATVISIAADLKLQPESRVIELDGQPRTVINADAIISLAKSADNPEARRIYRAYRKRKVELKRSSPHLDDTAIRQAAILGVLPVEIINR